MRLIDVDELEEKAWRFGLVTREYVVNLIRNAPTVEPKRGHWIMLKDKLLMCSACYSIAPYQEDYYGTVVKAPRYKFCSNCGAKMDEVTDGASDN